MANQTVKVTLTADAYTLVKAFKSAGVSIDNFDDKSSKAAKGFKQSWGEMKGLAGELGLAMGLGAITSELVQFTASSYDAALAQKDAKNALTQLLGSTGAYEDAIKQIQTATRGTVSETEAAQSAFGLLDNGIAKSAEEAAQYALAGKALNAALGETASYEKFLMLLDEGSSMLLNNFNITQSAVKQRQAQIQANSNLEESEARLQAVRELALEKGLALADSMSDETLARQQAAASYADFQASFGNLVSSVEQSFGVMEKSITLFDQMGEGAEAWGYIINEAVPAIELAARANDEMAGKSLATASSIEELDAALGSGIDNLDTVRRSLVAGTKSYDDYNAKLDELTQLSANNLAGFESTLAVLGTSRAEYDALKLSTDAEAAALAAQNAELALNASAMRLAGEAAYYNAQAQEAAAAATSTAAMEAERQAVMAQYVGGDTNRDRDALAAMRMGASQMPEKVTEVGQMKPNIDFDSVVSSARSAANSTQSAFEGAFNNLKSVIDNNVAPSLDEVWKPPEAGQENIDEAARRLATVSTAGFGSEWLTTLNDQFAGMDFWQPVADAMATGDDAALRTAANDILTNNVTALWDVDLIKERVRADLQAQNMRQEITNAIAEEMLAEGAISGETAAGAGGGAGILGQMMGDPATVATDITGTLQPAVDGLKSSLAGLGGTAGEAAGEGAAGGGSALTPLITDGTALDLLLNTTLPGSVSVLQTALQTAAEDNVAQLQLITDATTELDETIVLVSGTSLPDMQTAGENAGTKIKDGMKKAGDAIKDKLVPSIEKATRAFEKMADAARDAARAGNSAGSTAPGGGFSAGTVHGYASGTGGWETVPGGYPNDSYMIGLTSGEKFAVIPPGGSPAPAPVQAGGGASGGGGGGINIGTIVLHGVQNPRELFEAIEREARARGRQFATVN